MTKEKWTKGIDSDWSVDTGGGNTYIHIGPEGGDPVAIAIVPDSWDRNDDIDGIANLISAAPELYENLKECVLELEYLGKEGTSGLIKAKAALSKACGEQ